MKKKFLASALAASMVGTMFASMPVSYTHLLVQAMDGYFANGAHHLNVNVFGVEKLLDCQAHPEKPEYANFTIRVSGYAVKFIDLTKEQQDDCLLYTSGYNNNQETKKPSKKE